MLDIIVTHYKEPWQIGKKFFDMLGLQVAVNFDDIRVTLIHDGTDLFPDEYFSEYPYTVEQVRIDHAGVSAARNTGIERATQKWIQFCDFDDMYSNAFSLKTVLDVLDTDLYDVLWDDFWSVDRLNDGWVINRRSENVVFVHGKVFRREYLMQSCLRFDTSLEFNEDCLFCTTALETLPCERIGKINTPFPFYVWCYTPKSTTSTQANWWRAYIGGYDRNRKVVELFKKCKPKERYQAMVARHIWDSYYMLNLETMPKKLTRCLDDFRGFYKEHKIDFWTLDETSMQEVKNISTIQYETGERESLERWGSVPMKRREGVSIEAWLDGIEKGVY